MAAVLLPVAAFGTVEGEMLFLRGLYYNEETGNWFKDSILGNGRMQRNWELYLQNK